MVREIRLVENVPVLAYQEELGAPVTKSLVSARGAAELSQLLPHARIVFSNKNVYDESVVPSSD
jgi:hypothetical protein